MTNWNCGKCGKDLRDVGAFEVCSERNQYDFVYNGSDFDTVINGSLSRIHDCEGYHCRGCGNELTEDQEEAIEEIRI